MTKTHVFCITGPESSGKSTLAQDLSHGLSFRRIDEYARTYLNLLPDPSSYDLDDLVSIAKKQYEAIELASAIKGSTIIDTGVEVIKIWNEEKYNSSHAEIEALFKKQNLIITHYFLCSPEIPWEPDPLRENPSDRDVLFMKYEKLLSSLKLPYTIITGSRKDRLAAAKHLIKGYSPNTYK